MLLGNQSFNKQHNCTNSSSFIRYLCKIHHARKMMDGCLTTSPGASKKEQIILNYSTGSGYNYSAIQLAYLSDSMYPHSSMPSIPERIRYLMVGTQVKINLWPLTCHQYPYMLMLYIWVHRAYRCMRLIRLHYYHYDYIYIENSINLWEMNVDKTFNQLLHVLYCSTAYKCTTFLLQYFNPSL